MKSPAVKAAKTTLYVISVLIVALIIGTVFGKLIGWFLQYLITQMSLVQVGLLLLCSFVSIVYTVNYVRYRRMENPQ